MADEVIPAEVRRFLSAYIDSVAHLEALLLLHTSPEREWTVDETAQRLYVPPAQAGAVLAALEGTACWPSAQTAACSTATRRAAMSCARRSRW